MGKLQWQKEEEYEVDKLEEEGYTDVNHLVSCFISTL